MHIFTENFLKIRQKGVSYEIQSKQKGRNDDIHLSEGEFELKSTKYDTVGYYEIIKGILRQINPQRYTDLEPVCTKKHSYLFVNI